MSEELTEIKDDVKDLTKATSENSLAIRELITLATQTTKDTDKFMKHLEALLPLHTKIENIEDKQKKHEEEAGLGIRPATLKNLLIYAVVILLSFGVWTTNAYFSLQNDYSIYKTYTTDTHTHYETSLKELRRELKDAKNQAKYQMGRITGLSNRISTMKSNGFTVTQEVGK